MEKSRNKERFDNSDLKVEYKVSCIYCGKIDYKRYNAYPGGNYICDECHPGKQTESY